MVKLPDFVQRKFAIENAIYRGIERRNSEEQSQSATPPGVIRLSGIGRCQRRIWLQLNNPQAGEGFSSRILALFRLGHTIEDMVVDHLVDAGFPVTEQQKTLKMELPGGSIRGHIDGVVEVRGVAHLLEIKSANESRFEELERVGYEKWNPGYSDQLQAYMGLLQICSAICVVYNKNTSHIYVERVTFDHLAFSRIVEKAELILGSRDAPPERPKEARNLSCDFCRWCDVKEWCWGPTSDARFDT